jgi:hypothetical protein
MEVNPCDGHAYEWPCIYSVDYEIIGTEGFYGDLETDIANAKLIVQAPILAERLAALIDSETVTDAIYNAMSFELLDEARKALHDAGYYD